MGDDMMEEEEQLPPPESPGKAEEPAPQGTPIAIEDPGDIFLRPRLNAGFKPPSFLVNKDELESIRPPPVVQALEQHLSELSADEKEALSEMRQFATAKSYNPEEVDDWMLMRYLVARSWNVKKSSAMLEKTMEWRAKKNALALRCAKCDVNPNSHMMCFVGWDLQHRPVMYMSHRWAMDRWNVEENVAHVCETYNHMCTLMPEGVGKWVGCVDFVTFSYWKDGNPKSGKEVIGMLQDHFPERLGLQVLVDPPTTFWALWKIFSLVIDEKTKTKVSFQYTSQQPNIATEFPKIFPPHLSDYLVRQFNENKKK